MIPALEDKQMTFKQEGVWIAASGIVSWSEWHINFVERAAAFTQKKRARICAHGDDSNMHQMLIAHRIGTENPEHSHEKAESVLMLRGTMCMHIQGKPSYFLHAGEFLRIPGGVRHQPCPVTDCVFLECCEK